MPVHSLPEGWVLETPNTAYMLKLHSSGVLQHCYWGSRLPNAREFISAPEPFSWSSFDDAAHLVLEEYPAFGGLKYTDPCLKVAFADGVRELVLKFEAAVVHTGPTPVLDIRLEDDHYPFSVVLHYRLHEAYDLIERWVTLRNEGSQSVQVERVWSAQWHLPDGGGYYLNHLTGRWVDEFHLRREALNYGIKSLESRRLTTSHHHNPWFSVDRGDAQEEQGEVWFGALAWSGNWKLAVEVTDFGATRVNIGLNDWDFGLSLKGGETFDTPSSIAGYTQGGFGAASRALHNYIREQVIPHGATLHRVLYNSWEATLFDVEEVSQKRLADLVAEMGVELFVVDDGWFQHRNSDHAGLGDWRPDEQKFPKGLSGLINHVNSLGMDFGIWVEPEMVNPDSDLYRMHPDWVLHYPNRPRSEARNQLILNLARVDVQDYLIAVLDRLLSENLITFVKWDMNRSVSEAGWPSAPGDAREIWVRYVEGLYRVWGILRERHPDVFWQSCSGGGGRADLGILQFADLIWVSDNTLATSRLGIQEGFSQVFPANSMEAWVTDLGKDLLPLEFRFHVSMCGSLGVGGNLTMWSEEDRSTAARCIAQYKELRPLIQQGDLFRLRSAQREPYSAVQYMRKDRSEGVLFAFRTFIPEPVTLPRLFLRGLISDRSYLLVEIGETHSGAVWMGQGVQLKLADLQSTIIRIRQVD